MCHCERKRDDLSGWEIGRGIPLVVLAVAAGLLGLAARAAADLLESACRWAGQKLEELCR